MDAIPERFYRVSAKALILSEERDKFLIIKEETGDWELPGGGLEWGEQIHECLTREILEEMGLTTTEIAEHPSYFLSGQSRHQENLWIVNIVYETKVEHLDFVPSNECIEIKFIDATDIEGLSLFPQVAELVQKFHPRNHIQ